MSERTSNKQILEAINGLTAAITATMVAPEAVPTLEVAPEAAPTLETAPDQQPGRPAEPKVQVDKAYLKHMVAKVEKQVCEDGQDRILYARRNGRGETKLAYALASNWTALKDNGLIGPIQHISA